MKKFIAALTLCLPLTLLLCACGSTELSLGAYWYKSGDGNSVSGKSESLEYEVTFKPVDETQKTLSYGTGSYKTELKVEQITLSDDSKIQGYHLRAALEIPVTYTVGEATETFTDSIVSDVYFMTLSSRLQPVRSEKTVHSTSPLTLSPKTIDEAYEVYEYSYTVEYTSDLSKAAITYAQTLPEAKTQEKTISVKSKDIFFDNEQLLFVLRGVSMSSAVSMKTINPLTLKETGVTTSSPAALAYTSPFTLNGKEQTFTEEKPLKVYGVTLSYSGKNAGQPQKLVYAAKQDKGENTYRNLLLEMSVPVVSGFGYLDYKLKNATIND